MDQIAVVQRKIYEIRGQKVILDRDLAALYQVETKVLNQAVKRNIERFPEDFMFQLTPKELKNWKSQFVTSIQMSEEELNAINMGLRRPPYVFTEHGVIMLASLLRSEITITMSVQMNEMQRAINEETAMQLELINQSLAELQAKPKQKPMNPVGFNSPIYDDK